MTALAWPRHADFDLAKSTDVLPEETAWLVFDVETVRDPAFPAKKYVAKRKPGEVTWTPDLKQLAQDMLSTNFGDYEPEFPSPPECQVVSIAAVAVGARGELLAPYVLAPLKSEERKLWELSQLVQDKDISVCTWNGRRFDVPVVSARLMRYGWPSPFYKHDYRYRYARPAAGMHLDLADQLSDFGSGRMFSLDVAARTIGLPGKVFGDGSGVDALFAAGEHEKIDLYCLTDVVQTAFVLGRHLLLRGQMQRSEYREVVRRNFELAAEMFAGHPVNQELLMLKSVRGLFTKKEERE